MTRTACAPASAGPALLEDFHLREKIFHFDHERIPERVVHARGYGAHGYFETYDAIPDITRADLFQRKGEKTPALRAVLHGRRQPRFLRPRPRRARLRREAVHAGGELGHRREQHPRLLHPGPDQVPGPRPRREGRARPRVSAGAVRARQLLGLRSLMPESTHMLLWVMSDRAIPRSFRFMEGFGVHTFRFVNAKGSIHVREAPLEAEAGHAVRAVGRGREDQRRRPGLPPP